MNSDRITLAAGGVRGILEEEMNPRGILYVFNSALYFENIVVILRPGLNPEAPYLRVNGGSFFLNSREVR